MLKRGISLLLVLTMLLGYCPAVTVAATETDNTETIAVTEETAAMEETSALSEEYVEATEPVTEPSEETMEPTVPTEETVDPSEEIPEPSGDAEEPPEQTQPEETTPEETPPEETVSDIPEEGESEIGGTCGENLTWTFADGVLTVTGEGPMENFAAKEEAPWHDCREEILTVVIGPGITAIGYEAFHGCSRLTTVVLPESIVSIAEGAFACCDLLRDVQFTGSKEQWNSISVGERNEILCAAAAWLNTAEAAEEIPDVGVSEDFLKPIDQIVDVDDIPEGFIPVYNAEDLYAIENNRSGNYILMKDITFESTSGLCSQKKPFTGVLEGNGHTVSGLHRTEWNSFGLSWGLFAAIDGAKISNLKVTGMYHVEMGAVNDYVLLGALAGDATGDIEITNCVGNVTYHCNSNSSLTVIYLGGLIGRYTGSADTAVIRSCRNVADIAAIDTSGGIIGYCDLKNSNLTVEGCQNDGTFSKAVRESGDDIGGQTGPFGGIVGCTSGKSSSIFLAGCINNGDIVVGAAGGGILGLSTGNTELTIASCVNTGRISGNINVGGIAGRLTNQNMVRDCLNTGAISMNNAAYHAGGIAADGGKFYHCLNTGAVKTPVVYGTAYNSGIVDCPGSETEEQANAAVVDCYWLDDGQTNTLFTRYSIFDSFAKEIRTRGRLTKEELRKEENFLNFDFENVWKMSKALGHPVPVGVKINIRPNIKEYVDNQTIRINKSGSAYAYYQGDPNVSYCINRNGSTDVVKANEKGLIMVQLGSFDTVGTHKIPIVFTSIEDEEYEKPVQFQAAVTVVPLEYTQQWVLSISKTAGVSVGGAKVELGSFKAEATLGSFTMGAGDGGAVTLQRTWKDGKETLELLSDRAVTAEAGVESGITGKYKDMDVSLANASGKAEATGTVIYGLRIADYSPENRNHQKALAVFLLGESLKNTKNNHIAKLFYEKAREDAFSHGEIDLIEGNGAAISGIFDYGLASVEVNGIPVFSAVDGNTKASNSISQNIYDNGDLKYSTSYTSNKNLEAVSGPGKEGVLGMDYLGKDITVEVQKENGKKALETTSLSAALYDISTVTLGKRYTQDYNQYVFVNKSLEELMACHDHFRSYINGSRITVNNRDLKELAQFISSSETPIAYNNREKTRMLYALPFSFGLELGVGVDVDAEISYVQTVEHTTKSGYAVDDTLLLTSTSTGNSAEVNSKILDLGKMLREAITSLTDSVSEFFRNVRGKIQNGAETFWGWVAGKPGSTSDWMVSITVPDGEEGMGWNETRKVDASMDIAQNGGWATVTGTAFTVGRPFVIGVTEEETEIADLSSDPLSFTIRYVDSELQAAGFADGELQDGELAIYRYNETKDCFECVGGVHDPTEKTVTAEITQPGQYVLAIFAQNTSAEDDPDTDAQHSLTILQDYLTLLRGQSAQLTAQTTMEEQAENIRWTSDNTAVLEVEKETGLVTARNPGTAWVWATVTDGNMTLTDRCCITVTEDLQLEGVQLNSSKVTTELFRKDYATFEILLLQPENYPADISTYSLPEEYPGLAIEDIRFSDAAVAERFRLTALDDRTVMIIPTEYALQNPREVKGSYTSSVTVTVQGQEFTTEKLTLSVKKSTPKLKATVPDFNSFYSGQSREMVITGGTVTAVYEDTSKNTAKAAAIPNWLTLEETVLTLTEEAPRKSMSGKVCILVETEEWAIPAALTLTVKNAYKEPALKLSASTVTLATAAKESAGVQLNLQCKTKTDTLEKWNVSGITAPSGYSVVDFDAADGSFTLKAEEGFAPGKIMLNIHFSDTKAVLALPLTVRTAAVSLKTSLKSVTLNTAVRDSVVIDVTATPADYILSNLSIHLTDGTGKADKSGDLNVRYQNGSITVNTTVYTPAKATYKLHISAGGSKETVVTIKTVSAACSVTYKAKGNLDLSFPNRDLVVTPAFKNYNGGFRIQKMTAENAKKETVTGLFQTLQEGRNILVRCSENTPVGTYTLKLTLTLDNGSTVTGTVKVTVKRTAVKLKLSASKLSLNKAVGDAATVLASCTTKDYAFTAPVWQLMDKSGKNTANGCLDLDYRDGKLTVGVNSATEYGATYKLLLRAHEGAPAATLTVTVPSISKSTVTASLKTSGKLDVIRDGSAVTVVPSYKNCTEQAGRTEELLIYSSADQFTKPVTHLFCITPNGNGRYTITRAEGAQLDHGLKYKVKLVSRFGETRVESPLASVNVTMGSTKLILKVQGTTLFARDKNDYALLRFEAADAALNEVAKVEIKDAKYVGDFEVVGYGNGTYAIGFKDGRVNPSLIGKTVTLTLNVYLEGNQTAKANATAKLKLTVVK